MNLDDVYVKVQDQLDQQLPFVVYRKSKTNYLNFFFQKNKTLHTVKKYLESGFVFAPFDHNKEAVLIPYNEDSFVKVKLPSYAIKGETEDLGKHTLFAKNQINKKEHIDLVQKGVRVINSGNLKKVVLSRKEEVPLSDSVNALGIFKDLISQYQNAFVYLWYHPRVGTWLGATPETLLESKGNEIDTMALAGTLPYHSNADVVWEEKESEEQKMVVDFIQKGLSLISNKIISSNTYTHRAGTLLHLRTDIKAIVDDNYSRNSKIKEVVEILHPTPAVCGLPREEAKFFILNNEGYDRKFYTGFLGELNLINASEVESNLFVNLRCMELEENKAIVYVGGGITKDSVPEKEWRETVRKTETIKKVLS
ncbi:isochorismate synthase [Aquimarina sp. MMG016]|uniref:isochorismate synthase n=1 Tax=Aquimarina sp. MMG016 TaxID=2822690 RepID=UPI001B3A236F|nr:isochorismate synthase [Aquimarina sp. MMG016]MBQ4819149.1 isochorismate synthase [Aquimarina sp. MMG016]